MVTGTTLSGSASDDQALRVLAEPSTSEPSMSERGRLPPLALTPAETVSRTGSTEPVAESGGSTQEIQAWSPEPGAGSLR